MTILHFSLLILQHNVQNKITFLLTFPANATPLVLSCPDVPCPSCVRRCYVDDKVSRVAWLNRSNIIFAGQDKWSLDPRVDLVTKGQLEYSLRIQKVVPSIIKQHGAEQLLNISSNNIWIMLLGATKWTNKHCICLFVGTWIASGLLWNIVCLWFVFLCPGGRVRRGVIYLLHTDQAETQDFTCLPHCTRYRLSTVHGVCGSSVQTVCARERVQYEYVKSGKKKNMSRMPAYNCSILSSNEC